MTTILERPSGRPGPEGEVPGRRTCHFLMCPPSYFAVDYAINPWMDPTAPVDRDLAVQQWSALLETYRTLGHEVSVIEPAPGLPDMVFAANGALVVDGRVFCVRFRHDERAAEAALYRDWFVEAGFRPVRVPLHVNEGEGDLLFTGERVLAGTGFRTELAAHAEAQSFLGRPVVTLELVDPRFYHLDTALCVLDSRNVAYFPAAFSADSRALLERLYPDAVLADEEDAQVLGLNAVSDGRDVVLPAQATGLVGKLEERGYRTHPVDLSELRKAGGGPKCCTLEIRR